jgi:hypothetical protein
MERLLFDYRKKEGRKGARTAGRRRGNGRSRFTHRNDLGKSRAWSLEKPHFSSSGALGAASASALTNAPGSISIPFSRLVPISGWKKLPEAGELVMN